MPDYTGIDPYLPDHALWIRRAARVINNLLVGKLNVGGLVTLTPNASATTLNDPRLGPHSAVLLMPTTATAAAALATTFVAEAGRGNGSVVLTHAAAPSTDRSFRYVILG